MKHVSALIERLRKQGVFINVKNSELNIKAEKGIVTSKILEEIKENKQAIISFFLKKQARLSFAQERLWFLDQYNHSNSYNIPLVISIQGKLDVDVIEKTLAEIIRRHEVLRTNFITVNDEPIQVIHEEARFKLDVSDLTGFARIQADEQISLLIKKASSQSFDLENDSLIKVMLYKINDEESVLYMNIHHIISDGWSFAVLTKEIAVLYEAFAAGKAAPLDELPIQYADYAVWQREYLQGEVLQKQSEYWKSKLTGVTVLELPTDRIRPGDQTFNGDSLPLHVSKEVSLKLEALSKEHGVTLFMTLLSIFKILLSKYSGQEDISVGSPIANRTRSEVEGLIGFFVNTLALRDHIDPEARFTDLLAKVKTTTLDAYDHQDLPFEKVVDIVGQERSLAYAPLFQVMMILQNNPHSELDFSGLTLKPVPFKSSVSKFDISLEFTGTEDGLAGIIEYNTDLFNQATIERMIGHFVVLAEQVVAHPEKQIKALTLLTEREAHQLLTSWNDTRFEYPDKLSVVELFEQQCQKTPHINALVYQNEKITYQELNEKANQLAHYLISKGVKSETLVVLLLERSIDFIIGVLAILKSGAAYIPVDPGYPEQRINDMLEDSGARYIITHTNVLSAVSVQEATIINLDGQAVEVDTYPKHNPEISIQLKDLLYVIYTSGSTGKPKGVMGIHEGLLNRLYWGWDTYPFKANEVCCQKTSISFVDHVAEIFAPLLKGVVLHIFSENDTRDTEQFTTMLINNHVSRIVVVPSLLNAIISLKRKKNIEIPALQYVFCSGESLPLQLVNDFYKEFKHAKLINVYGSSEISADVTAYQINRFNEDDVLQYFNNLYLADTIKGPDHYHDTLADTSTFTAPEVDLDFIAGKFQDYTISNYPISIEEYYKKLYKDVLPYIINTACPQYIGHMTSALPDYVHDISKLISRLNQNLVKVESSKSLIFLEREALAILHKSFYAFPDEFYSYNIQKVNNNLGVISTGGTISNITALLTARNKKLYGADLYNHLPSSIYKTLQDKGYRDIVVLGSKLMHYSIKKATSLLGLGSDNIIFIDNDQNGRINIQSLQHKIDECHEQKLLIMAIIGIAGATETGDIDPLEEMAQIAKANDIHFHVDAAWGGTTVFSDKYKSLLKGIEQADSITLCGHKQLFLPQGISMCLFKDPLQAGYNTTLARYQATPNSYDFGRFTIEGSRSALSLCLHSSLRVIGKKGYELLVDNGIEKARLFADMINSIDGFELIKYPQINILNYRYIPEVFRESVKNNSYSALDNEKINEANIRIQENQFYKGKTFVSKTTLDDVAKGYSLIVFRVVLSNPLTTKDDLIQVIKDQLDIANELLGEHNNVDGLIASIEGHKIASAEQENDTEGVQVSIGKPLPNISAYILDANHNLVPIGVRGELCIAGAGLSRGYLGNEQLTNEKFIDNPYNPGEKLYKTGDLVRWLPDGNIQFLGRIDKQVKIRGFRIELGEIEAALNNLQQVKSSLVLVKDSKAGKRLVAYVVPVNTGEAPDSEELRKTLFKTLPDYMVPSLFLALAEIPLTANGKIDTKALSDLDCDVETKRQYVAPETETEKKLAQMWSDVMGVATVGVNDNFFELGGHSLLAAKIISQIRTAFNNDLPLKLIFENSTIKSLSAVIDGGLKTPELSNRIPVSPIQDNIQLSNAQKRLYFLYDINKQSTAYNMPVMIKLEEGVNKEKLAAAFNKLIERHSSLRTSFELVNNALVQRIAKETKIEIEYFEAENQETAQIISEFTRPFNLNEAPLIRVGVITSSEEHLMLVDIHHIITDGISNGILKNDFYNLYHGKELPALTIQYKDYTIWQNTAAQQDRIKQQEDYWLKVLQGNLPLLKIPTDFHRTNNDTDHGGFVSVYLSAEENRIIDRYCKQHGMTANMLLFALFNILLSKLSGQKDIITGLSISGRTHAELEGVVGFFVNALPVRTFPEHNKLTKDFIREIKETLLSAYENQECPFNNLTEKLKIQRVVGRNPIFDVMLNFIEHIDEDYDLAAEHATSYVHATGTKRFDLTLNVTQYLNTLYLNLQYDADLFRAETVELFLRYFKNIIAALNDIEEKELLEINLETAENMAIVYDKLLLAKDDTDAPVKLVPASYHQERLWFIDQFESGYLYEGGPVYHNIPVVFELNGLLDLALLEQSIAAVINRYQVLRTQIITIDERPFQQISDDFTFRLEYHIVDHEAAGRLIHDEINKPFKLDELSVRAVLYGYGDDQYKLAIIVHHSIADRYSVDRLSEEIFNHYKAYLNGAALADTKVVQYAQFSQWQQNTLSRLELPLLSYWKHQLAGKLKALELPTDRQRAAIHIYEAASIAVSIPADTVTEVLKYGIATGIEAGTIFMAAFKILLQKYADSEEIVIGTSFENRASDALKGAIGPIANLNVVRSFISPDMCFNDYVYTLDHTLKTGMPYREQPFDKLVIALAPEKDMSRTALFDVLYQYEDTGAKLPDIEGLEVHANSSNLGYGKYDLNLLLKSNGNEIKGHLVYNACYHDQATIETLITHYNELLKQLLIAPSGKLAEIDLLNEDERLEILSALDHTDVNYPKDKTIVDYFLEQVKRTPDHVAVMYENESVTYAALDRKSTQLAVLLRNAGVEANQPVGLLIDRSIKTIIAMLAILKAGGAYLPIDIDYPEDRIKYMINNSGTTILLTTTDLVPQPLHDIQTIFIEDLEKVSLENEAIAYTAKPSDLCYIIYTSGTTGNPKGVMVEHRNLVRLFFNDHFQFNFSSNDVWSMFHSHCFDFSVWEMYGALLFGGKLVIIPKAVARDTVAYLQILKEKGVTVLNQTPSAFYNLIHHELLLEDSALQIRYVIFGGEALAPGKLRRWREKYPDVRLINMYGITETTVHVTYKEIGDYEIEQNVSNIGKPIPTLAAYVLDENKRPVPNGVKGELYIGGAGVSRGYIHNDELTAQKFIRSPFNPDERLYKSGDLARILNTGELEYIGRIDNQVQLRGFRIELGEIECNLLAHKEIKEAVVAAIEKGGDLFLVGYYVADQDLEVSKLRTFLSGNLPDYMVPSYYVRLAHIPLTSNGKLDKNALPDPVVKTGKDYVAPSTEIEHKLAAIWCEALGLEKVGVTDDFFELGGHSLLATQVISKIRSEFNSELPLKVLFENSAIANIAQLIENNAYEGKNEAIKKANYTDGDIAFNSLTDYEEVEF